MIQVRPFRAHFGMKILLTICALIFGLQIVEGDEKPADPVLAKLERIRIPKVVFKDTTIEEAVDFIRFRRAELDPEPDPNRKGVSFLVRPAKGAKPPEKQKAEPFIQKAGTLSLEAVDVPLLDLVKRLAVQAKLDAYVTSVGIVLCASGTPPFPNETAAEGKILRVISKVENKIPEP